MTAATSPSNLDPIRAIELRDDKPGHYHCADAILAAIARVRPVDIEIVTLNRPRLYPPPVLSALTNRRTSPLTMLTRIYGLDATRWPAPDLIVSAGGDTLAANIAAARLWKVPNIFFGSLRRYRAEDFSLVLTCYDIDQPAANHLQIPKPVPADPDTLPAVAVRADGLPAVAGLLIGGNAGTITFQDADWSRLIAFLQDTHACLNIRWIVSNSRRTPPAVGDRLAALAAEPKGPLAHFIDVRTSGPGTLGRLFAESGVIVVTADSSAMLSEAVWMRRPALAVAPAALRHPAKEAQYRRRLAADGVCRELPIASLTPDVFADAVRALSPLTGNPQADLATLLKTQLPRLFATGTS